MSQVTQATCQNGQQDLDVAPLGLNSNIDPAVYNTDSIINIT